MLSVLASLLLLFGSAFAGPGAEAPDTFDPAEAVPVEILLSHDPLVPGEPARLAAVYHVPDLYHITDIANGLFYLEADTLDGLRLDNVRYPEGLIDEHGDRVYRGQVVVTADIHLPESFDGGFPWNVYAGFQVCSETGALTCYLPVDHVFEMELNLGDDPAEMEPRHTEIFEQDAAGSTDAGEGLEGRLSNALESGSFLAFLIVFLLGLLSSLTPCVYPMIPITISFIGARSGSSKFTGFIQSCWFVLGMALVFSSLGVIAAATGGVFGAVGQSPAFLIGLAVIFLILATSMFGAFELQVPSALLGKMTATPTTGLQEGKGPSPFGAMFMGGVTGFVAAPCVGPVIATLLVFIANTGNLLQGFFLMLAYALGMGTLFLVIGTFAGAMNALPGAGSWMETVKHFFGVVMVAMALWFLRTLIPAEVMVYLVGGGLVIFGVYCDAFTQLKEDAGKGAKFIKAVGLIAVLIGARYLIWGVDGPAATVVSAGGGTVTQAHAEVPWTVASPESNIQDQLLNSAVQAGKPVIMDFWAEWCVQCKELDHETWSDPAVMAEAERFETVKMDMTKTGSDWARAANQDYAIVGMPTVIFFDSSGEEVKRFNGFHKADKVLEWMKAVR